jgi:hypothetical protein
LGLKTADQGNASFPGLPDFNLLDQRRSESSESTKQVPRQQFFAGLGHMNWQG